MSPGLRKLEQELVLVQSSGYRWVGMLRPVHEEFSSIDPKWKARLERYFHNYGIRGTTMPNEHFNSEGRHSTGGPRPKQLLVCAFKAFQHRLYGFSIPFKGTETFVGTRLITDKKRNRADRKLLRRMAEDFQPYVEE